MAVAQDEDQLSERRSVVVVLRLVLDQRARLMYGELVSSSNESLGHFTSWKGLTAVLRRQITGRLVEAASERGEGPV